jgi:transcriptional regulator with XRE-family HTH domain
MPKIKTVDGIIIPLKTKVEIGKMIFRLRNKRHKTKSQFSRLLGVSRQYYDCLEGGEVYPNYEVFATLKATGENVNRFFELSDEERSLVRKGLYDRT